MHNEVNSEIAQKIKEVLSIFDKVGVASKDSVVSAPAEYHPKNFLEDFNSAIVFAQGNLDGDSNDMGGFSDYLATISAQVEAVNYLESLGYKAVIVDGTATDISLVQMGVAAAVGELSPVNSLLVRGFGLTATLGAIITDAVLAADEKVENICTRCDMCLSVCQIRDEAYAEGDLSICGCGACYNICPE